MGCGSESTGPNATADQSVSTSKASASASLKGNPSAFASALDSLGNNFEVIIAVKPRDTKPISTEFLRSQTGASSTLLAAAGNVDAARRSQPGFASKSRKALSAVESILTQHGAVFRRAKLFPVIFATLDEQGAVSTLSTLMRDPNVDYIEANQESPVYMDAGPSGSNPAGSKHDMHLFQEAWDFTRGEGAKVGIIDSGYPVDHSDGG